MSTKEKIDPALAMFEDMGRKAAAGEWDDPQDVNWLEGLLKLGHPAFTDDAYAEDLYQRLQAESLPERWWTSPEAVKAFRHGAHAWHVDAGFVAIRGVQAWVEAGSIAEDEEAAA